MTRHFKKLSLALALASTTALIATDAFATEGYFTHGSGARNKAMAGAGVADGRDASSLIINPAGMVGNGTEFDIAVSLFAPQRKFLGSGGPGFTTNGVNESSENLFAIPNIAYIHAIDDTSSWGISLAANGGMNTNYRNVGNPVCGTGPFPAPNGPFCGGTTGINLNQALISVGYAKQMGSLKFGIAPIFGFQMFEATGLQVFGFPTGPGRPAPSSNPAALSNNGIDTSTGFGGKIGLEWELSEQVRIGGVYQTKIKMSAFDKYAGLFADGGDFDIPSNFQIGISADMAPNFTVNLDYRHISYSGVGSVSNSSRTPQQFGSAGGPGFGWDSIDVFKVGAEWRANDQWKLRAGYAHNQQPISGDDVTLNLLAPGVVTDHFTFGGEYSYSDRSSFEFGVMYAPPESVNGIEVTPNGPNPGHRIDIKMNQFEATFGWKIKFGQ